MTTQHTPTPVDELADWVRAQVRQWHRSTDQNRKAGAKMVEKIADRAVNAHDDLVAMLTRVVESGWIDKPECGPLVQECRVALAQAKGK